MKFELNNNLIYTDLACERRRADLSVKGVTYTETESDGITISTLLINSKEGAKSIGRDEGTYITVSFNDIWMITEKEREKISGIISQKIADISEKNAKIKIEKDTRAMIVGLGNENITADAIGPLVSKKINATRHIKSERPEIFSMLNCSSLCVIAPGVMSQNGIETSEYVKKISEYVHPDIIITVDALVARSEKRLARTIQISDTGISPGSGVGNHRDGINRKSTGVPVISIGVPTVINSATFIFDFIEKSVGKLSKNIKKDIMKHENFFVTPKECDSIVNMSSEIISDAINRTFGTNI